MRNSILFILLIVIAFISCRKKGCTDPIANNYDLNAVVDNGICLYDLASPNADSLELNIVHVFDNELFSFDSVYQDSFGNKIQFTRATFYLGNPRYENGNTLDSSNSYILVNPSISTYNIGPIKPGAYLELDFLMGVDLVTNHLNPASYNSANPLSYQTPSMHWQMGISPENWSYLFIVLEGLVDKNGNNNFDTGENFVFHVGNDGLTTEINDLAINLLITEGENGSLDLEADWSRFFDGIDLSINNFTHTTDNPTLAATLSSNGLNVIQTQ
tara:strand:+ start:12 stop:827 length:816 start_codon:yes stop_codon:yes gene_type:complete